MKSFQTVSAILGLAWCLLACSPETRAPKAKTRSSLRNVHYTIAFLQSETHKTISMLLAEIPSGTSLQEKWAILVANAAAKDGLDPTQLQKSLCEDGFRRLFNVEFKTNLVAMGASTNLTTSEFDVAIWSSGYNGTNELGRGDDIVLIPE